MNQSPNINELATALAKAQGSMGPAIFDKENTHLRSRYASFTSVVQAVRVPLSVNGLSFTQSLKSGEQGLTLETRLLHSSGQWIATEIPMFFDKNNMQGVGSAISYAKRYGLSALVGCISDDEDDDGEASIRGATQAQKPQGSPTLVRARAAIDVSEYVIPFGKFEDKTLAQVGPTDVRSYMNYL